jgi:protein phosphatase
MDSEPEPAPDPATPVLRLPDPCLVVLAGAAGSGKSTFAARHFAQDEVLSSDAFRARVSGDPTDQRATPAAFAALHRELRRRLAGGRLTVVDATNVRPMARRGLLREASAAGVPAVLVVLALDPRLVHARNAARPGGLAVPEAALERHLADVSALVDPAAPAGRAGSAGSPFDGFARVLVLRDPREVEAVRIMREPTRGRVAPAARVGPGKRDRGRG